MSDVIAVIEQPATPVAVTVVDQTLAIVEQSVEVVTVLEGPRGPQGVKGDKGDPGLLSTATEVVQSFIGTANGSKYLRDDGTLAVPTAELPEATSTSDIEVDDTLAGFLQWRTVRAPRVFAATIQYGLIAPLASTTTETALTSAAATIPADTLSVNDLVRLVAGGIITNNTGSPQDVTLRVRLEGATYFTTSFTAIPTNATGRPFRIAFVGAVYTLFGEGLSGSADARLGAAGGGALEADLVLSANASIDETTPLDFDITAELGASSADFSVGLSSFVVEQLPS